MRPRFRADSLPSEGRGHTSFPMCPVPAPCTDWRTWGIRVGTFTCQFVKCEFSSGSALGWQLQDPLQLVAVHYTPVVKRYKCDPLCAL